MRIANLQGKRKAGETSPSLKSILRKLDEDEDLESITQMDFQESIGRGKIAMTVEREKKGKIPALANLAEVCIRHFREKRKSQSDLQSKY